ncbi:MAG: DUF4838 domain-containing protein [Lentisphaeria bacterium]|nr:DUF4838 domain-containing protein [Lentisphaeria bacterium]
MKKKTQFFSLVFFTVLSLFAGEYRLTDNGRNVSHVVISKNPSPAEQHAAKELAFYLAKISGTGKADRPDKMAKKGKYNIFFVLTNNKTMTGKSGIDVKKLTTEDSFALSAKEDGLYIVARQKRGLLYGVYEILKKYGGIRWLFPGKDGEYFTARGSISIPAGITYHVPSFTERKVGFTSANITSNIIDSWDWCVRNNMRFAAGAHILRLFKDLSRNMHMRAVESGDGGHVLGNLLTGYGIRKEVKNYTKALKDLYAAHPEYFPMVNGKRIPLEGHAYQPCTSNKEVLKIMTENLLLKVKEMTPGGEFLIGNMDGTGWCECKECALLDPPEEKKAGFVSTRYWTMVNAIAREVWKKYPDVKLSGWAYQNFQVPPVGVEPDSRLKVYISFNRRCYRHELRDPSCETNKVFCKYFDAWKKVKCKLWTRDEIGVSGSSFVPVEAAMVKSLVKDYDFYNLSGMGLCMNPPDGVYGPRYDNKVMTKLSWYGMWQGAYMTAQFLWNKDQDYDKMYEEINSLCYGKAWEGGMKRFRELMTKAFHTTPGCFGWGLGSPLGLCLEDAALHKEMRECLEKAEKAVLDDHRALKHVMRDRYMFDLTWEKERRDFVSSYLLYEAPAKTEEIKLDGVLDEADWVNAPTGPVFKQFMAKPQKIKYPTKVKILHTPEALYFGIECTEPYPAEKLIALAKSQDHVKIWSDNKIEIFISHPDQGGSYHHLAFNHKGVLYDAFNQMGDVREKTAFVSEATVAVKFHKGKWVAEVKVPTGPLGMKCNTGNTWKINVSRTRVAVDTPPRGREMTSMSNGHFHNADNFTNVKFVPAAKKKGFWSFF